MAKTTLFSKIYFTLFFALLLGLSGWAVVHHIRTRNERRSADFRAAVTEVTLKHGASTQYFVRLSTGHYYLFTIPPSSLGVGDSVLKRGGDDFFVLQKRTGTPICRVDLSGVYLP